jgi:DNA gyrase subunit A
MTGEETLGAETAQDLQTAVVLQTEKGLLLRFETSDVPKQKKTAIGARGMKLGKEDTVEKVYVADIRDSLEIDVHGVKVDIGKLKLKKRDQAGQKVKS